VDLPWAGGATDRIFYDGSCGLCYRLVHAVIAEDRRRAFRFTPLASGAFGAAMPPAARAPLADSIRGSCRRCRQRSGPFRYSSRLRLAACGGIVANMTDDHDQDS
jgi:DCC1-like thiol-disulfide oxidoreductase